MTDIASLSAQVDEDERLARAATELPNITPKFPEKRPPWEPERWSVDRFGDVVTVNGDRDPISDCGPRSEEVAEHIAHHDPHRTVAEVALKRLILREHVSVEVREYSRDEQRYVPVAVCEACSMDPGPFNDAETVYEPWPCDYIKALTDIYGVGTTS